MAALITLPDTKPIEKQAAGLLARAENLTISDEASYRQAGDLLLDIRSNQSKIEPILEEPVKVQRKALEEIRAWRDRFLKPIEHAREVVAGKIGEWEMKLRGQRRREQEEALRRAIQKAQEERAAQLKALKAKKDREALKELQRTPIVPVVEAPQTPEPPELAGVHTSYRWTFELIDASKLSREFLCPDLKAIGRAVTALGANAAATLGPGVRVYEVPVTTGRIR
jgi:hypothetical protein